MKKTGTQVKKVAESVELFNRRSLIIEEKTLGILKHVEYIVKRQHEEINCLVEYLEIVNNFRKKCVNSEPVGSDCLAKHSRVPD